MSRIDFGETSSPFLLNCVIYKHVQTYNFDAEFVQKVIESFHVNDFIGEASSIVFELFKKLNLRFLEGTFDLRCVNGERMNQN